MKDTYIYPAILTYCDNGIAIEFPDVPGCFSCADTTEEVAKNTKEALGLHMWSIEKDSEKIPTPSDIRQLKLEDAQIPLLVEVFMPPFREKLNNRFTKKTLSIPFWLNATAEAKGVNFSKTLQRALKEELQIAD
ncbi:MAG: type II toxin-antitoxin system HicB family antitoxin [Turicibacter sp.]|nr:type II toxin-antitoxin system HicB family antitoxin [Turicibacter sp.]